MTTTDRSVGGLLLDDFKPNPADCKSDVTHHPSSVQIIKIPQLCPEVQRLQKGQEIDIDGRLEEDAWAEAP